MTMESAILYAEEKLENKAPLISKGFCSLEERKRWLDAKRYLDQALSMWRDAVELQNRPVNIVRKRVTTLNMERWNDQQGLAIAVIWLRFRTVYGTVLLCLTLPTSILRASYDTIEGSRYTWTLELSPDHGGLSVFGIGAVLEVEKAVWLFKNLLLFAEGVYAIWGIHLLNGSTLIEARKGLLSMISTGRHKYLSSYDYWTDTLSEFLSKEDLWNALLE